jgi:myo-inositol-1(or 4)-monophosphatase
VTDRNQDLEVLLAFATSTLRRAGEIALSFHGKGRPAVKFDQGLVTEIELRLAEFFQEQIGSRFPEHLVLKGAPALEGYTHDDRRYLWIFDPIDGVANMQAGIPIWGTSLALLDNFWPIFGLFYMPRSGDFFDAVADRPAQWCGLPVQVSPQQELNDESLLLTYSRFHHHYRCDFPGKMRNFGCTGAHLCYVAMGRADAAVLANVAYHDLAAGGVILEAAGGRIFRLDGQPFSLSAHMDGAKITEDLLAVSPRLCDPVRACLDRSG